LHVEPLEERTVPATFIAEPVSFSGAVIDRLGALLAHTVIPGSTVRQLLGPQAAVLNEEAATLSPAGQQQLAALAPKLEALTEAPAITGQTLVEAAGQFIDFLKDKPALKTRLDQVLNQIVVPSDFLFSVVVSLNEAAAGRDTASLAAFLSQEDFILSHPFVSGRFLAFLGEELNGDFVDTGPVALSLSGLSAQMEQPGEVSTFPFEAPETGQLLVEVDGPAGGGG
jgi:hypothetical protein